MPQESSTTRESAHSQKLLSSHPLAIALTFIVVLFFAGSAILAHKEAATVVSGGESAVWASSGTVTLENPTAFTPTYSSNLQSPQTSSEATDTRPLYTYAPAPATTTNTKGTDLFDYKSFLKELADTSGLSTSGVTAPTVTDTGTAYAYIPTGLISTSTTRKRTSDQDALFRYGNAVGAIIKKFEAAHPDEIAVLAAQASDRTNPGKAQALRDLGAALSKVGDDINALTNTPTVAVAAQHDLAKGYNTIGKKLSLVADAKDDTGFIAAINSYNAAADSFARAYSALATVFSVSSVSFSSADTGSVFTFSNSASF